MNAELIGVVLLGLSYLGLLFGCGMAVERGWVPVRITRHPMVYTLALGVYASAWAIYGSIELAANAGFGYLDRDHGANLALHKGPDLTFLGVNTNPYLHILHINLEDANMPP